MKIVSKLLCEIEKGLGSAYLERVLSGKTLIAVSARERLDCKVYPFMSLQVVIAIEALRTLIAPERAVVLWARLLVVVSIHLLHVRRVAAVEAGAHAMVHAAHHLHVAVGVVDVRENGPGERVRGRPIVWLRVCLERGNRSRTIDRREFHATSCAMRALLYRRRPSRVLKVALVWVCGRWRRVLLLLIVGRRRWRSSERILCVDR